METIANRSLNWVVPSAFARLSQFGLLRYFTDFLLPVSLLPIGRDDCFVSTDPVTGNYTGVVAAMLNEVRNQFSMY